jgi:hypothetical protein
MEFVHVAGDHRINPGEDPVKIVPRQFGHDSFSFRGKSYPLVHEGSAIYLRGLPDNVTQAERYDLAAHGFIFAGMVATGVVEQAVKSEVGSTDLKAALEHEAALRAEANKGDGAGEAQHTDAPASDGPAAPPRKKQ